MAADDPVITVPWAASSRRHPKCRFVDLRLDPHLIDEIEEARARPALRSALLLLNGVTSQLWTAKCDAWSSSAEQGDDPFDPYEMDAEPGETALAPARTLTCCRAISSFYQCFDSQERWLRAVTERAARRFRRARRG